MPAKLYSYVVVDVFTETPFEGNPLAVFLDASGLDGAQMQTLARELNLSETSFVFPAETPRGTARIRIFTPNREVAFAGHPTIGTAYALVASGRADSRAETLILEENVGPIDVRIERRADPFVAWMRTPPITFGARYDREGCVRALGLAPHDLFGEAPAQIVTAGNPFLYVPIRDRAAVDRAELDLTAITRIVPDDAIVGVFVFTPESTGVYARMFAPMSGIREDPATGSATGPLGAYLAAYGMLELRDGVRFVNEQGVMIRRRSLIHGIIRVRSGALETVEVGGSAVKVIDATVTVS
ncbi:MAG TPA: PhzF family phenazine biosynthesis protein [Candidatus Binataceae bacterium]|nr:PhzF family phenazine biosynthesis protein [Candidatus Binataceae bacterium]